MRAKRVVRLPAHGIAAVAPYRGIAAFFAAAAVLLVTAGAAQGAPPAGGPPTPSSPDEAKALAATKHPADVTVRRASIAEARAAAQQPGADTEGSLDPGVGALSAQRGLMSRQRALAIYCWSATIRGYWGTWPYEQKVYDHTYWCGYYGGSLTYRTTNVTHGSTLCDGSGDYSFRLAGGIPYSWVEVEAGAYFSCPTTIPWITIHRHDWLHDYYNTWGTAYAYDWS